MKGYRLKPEYAWVADLHEYCNTPMVFPPQWMAALCEDYVKPEPLSPEIRAKFDAAFIPKE